jgi:hypothetical protein
MLFCPLKWVGGYLFMSSLSFIVIYYTENCIFFHAHTNTHIHGDTHAHTDVNMDTDIKTEAHAETYVHTEIQTLLSTLCQF